ncbi:MAG: helix-turn-helix domain-containing protein [Alphaproteobacteria bacterium]
MTKTPGRIGSTFDDFLKDEGVHEETTAIAVKRVLAWQLTQAMADRALSKNQMARSMNTSRSQLDRILDPDNDRIQLDTIIKAAKVLGRELRIELI